VRLGRYNPALGLNGFVFLATSRHVLLMNL
jgi:hypothetical protein